MYAICQSRLFRTIKPGSLDQGRGEMALPLQYYVKKYKFQAPNYSPC